MGTVSVRGCACVCVHVRVCDERREKHRWYTGWFAFTISAEVRVCMAGGEEM